MKRRGKLPEDDAKESGVDFDDEPPSSSEKQGRASVRGGWGLNFVALAFVATCVISFPTLMSVNRSLTMDTSTKVNLTRKTLSFELCNGISNQKLSLLYGVIAAVELGRVPVIPEFYISASSTPGSLSKPTPMEEVYDLPYFRDMMYREGIATATASQVGPLPRSIDTSRMKDLMLGLADFKDKVHLSIGCPTFLLPKPYFTGVNSRIAAAVLRGLKPAPPLQKHVDTIIANLQRKSPDGAFNFLHLRVEPDWLAYCQKKKGLTSNNCINNTDSVDGVLRDMAVRTEIPLYIASNWGEVDAEVGMDIRNRLAKAGYQSSTMQDFITDELMVKEHKAIIDFEVSLHALKMVGNSMSSFTSLSMLQRSNDGLWASYYNGGDVLLNKYLPMDVFPWVFTYTSEMTDWDYMMKAAVRSAAKFRTTRTFCIWSGNTSVPIFEWLVENGVTMIFHEPTWVDELWKKAEKVRGTDDQRNPIFPTRLSLQNAFMRMDLPVIPDLDRYVYILFTQPDIYFKEKVELASFNSSLPEVFAMVDEPAASNGVDGGVMIYNMPGARRAYQQFKVFLLRHKTGPFFLKGLGVVGAYLEFGGKMERIDNKYAAKPFKAYDPSSVIVRFQGPKPHEYQEYLATGVCPKGKTRCQDGLSFGLCTYIKSWMHLVNETESLVGLALRIACIATLETPTDFGSICADRDAARAKADHSV